MIIIGILFIIKGAFNIFKGLNYYIFKDRFKTIPMELTAVYKSAISIHEITYIYCYQSIHQGTNIKCKTKGHDSRKDVGDMDIFYYDEKLHFVYGDEEDVIPEMVNSGIVLFLIGLGIVYNFLK